MEKQIREIIAQHVGGTYEAKQKCAEEILRLFSVVGQSEKFYCGKHYYHCEGRCEKQCNDCLNEKTKQ